MLHPCPNCDATMNDGEACPECPHVDWDDFCECTTCVDARADLTDEIYDINQDDDDEDEYDDEDSELEDEYEYRYE